MRVTSQLQVWRSKNLDSSCFVHSVLWIHQGRRPRARSFHGCPYLSAFYHDPLLVPRNPASSTVEGQRKGEEEGELILGKIGTDF